MPATRYKIWGIGKPVGTGATGSIYVGGQGIAKVASADLPYVVVNELICAHLAKAILLPIPPGFIIENEGTPYYVSMDFNLSGEGLPPADAELIAQKHPELTCGIILFDIWILNDDRHNQNIAYDQATDKVQIFDHSHALLSNKDPRTYLEGKRDQLGIGDHHCLGKELNSLEGMREWVDRISLVPEFYIREVVESVKSVGLSSDQADFCKDFLLERRGKLLDLVRANTAYFQKVQPSLWDNLL